MGKSIKDFNFRTARTPSCPIFDEDPSPGAGWSRSFGTRGKLKRTDRLLVGRARKGREAPRLPSVINCACALVSMDRWIVHLSFCQFCANCANSYGSGSKTVFFSFFFFPGTLAEWNQRLQPSLFVLPLKF